MQMLFCVTGEWNKKTGCLEISGTSWKIPIVQISRIKFQEIQKKEIIKYEVSLLKGSDKTIEFDT